MTKTYRFYKEEDNRWYIHIAEWPPEDKAELEMVMGADVMLDMLSGFGNEIRLKLSDTEFAPMMLTFDYEESGGGVYTFLDVNENWPVAQIWLCEVTKYVFEGKLPQTIYLSRV